MRLFQFKRGVHLAEPDNTTRQHPAFQSGKQVVIYLTRLELRLAKILNQGQHRIGLRARNAILLSLGAFFLLYFIALLTQ